MKNLCRFLYFGLAFYWLAHSIHAADYDGFFDSSMEDTKQSNKIELEFAVSQKPFKGMLQNEMQDFYIAQDISGRLTGVNYLAYVFAILDGHGPGSDIARILSSQLVDKIVEAMDGKNDSVLLTNKFNEIFEELDKQFEQEAFPKQGSCVLVVVILDNNIVVANAGSSRALFCTRDEVPRIWITEPHTSDNPKERMRVLDSQVEIIFPPNGGMGRLWGEINVFRSVGDYPKLRGLIYEPDLGSDLTSDNGFIVMAVGSVWRKFSANKVVYSINKWLKDVTIQQIADKIVDSTTVPYEKHGDTTVIFIRFYHQSSFISEDQLG